MASLHLSAMMEHVPLYLDGCLSYISSRSLRPSPTLKPSDPILNTASILLSLHSLSPLRALSSRHFPWLQSPRLQRLSKFAISPTPSTSPPPLCNSILHSFPFAYLPHFFLSLYSSLIPIKRQHRNRCLRSLTTHCPIGFIAYNIKHNPHSTTLSSRLMLSPLIFESSFLPPPPPSSLSRSWWQTDYGSYDLNSSRDYS
jgi:hypothetical protein